jgi:hypothetical protein
MVNEVVWDEGTVQLRHTDKEGRVHYTEHRVWNAGRFIAQETANALIMGGNCIAVSRAEYEQHVAKYRRK